MTLNPTLIGVACPTIPVVTVGYIIVCYLSPFKACPRCQATGLRRAALGRKRLCKRCRTTGRVPRIGIRVYNHLRRLHRELSKGAK